MVLMATTRSMCGSRARYTIPIAPRPTSARISYRPKLCMRNSLRVSGNLISNSEQDGGGPDAELGEVLQFVAGNLFALDNGAVGCAQVHQGGLRSAHFDDAMAARNLGIGNHNVGATASQHDPGRIEPENLSFQRAFRDGEGDDFSGRQAQARPAFADPGAFYVGVGRGRRRWNLGHGRYRGRRLWLGR